MEDELVQECPVRGVMTGRVGLHDFGSFYFIGTGFAIDPMHKIFCHDCRWVWLKIDGLRQMDESNGRADV